MKESPGNPDRFRVRYWGVRGSIPTPGLPTVRYGGNTTCIAIECGHELLIIDAGSGIRALGGTFVRGQTPFHATLLFSHLHWDHIQGYPFFAPAFWANTRLDLWSDRSIDGDLLTVLRGQFAQPTFPVSLDDMAAAHTFHHVEQGGSFSPGPGIEVQTAPLNHPGGATAFRVNFRGRSFVHASDHEHASNDKQASDHRNDPSGGSNDSVWEPLRALAQGADYLSYDATYTDGEYHGRAGDTGHIGWGHSTWQEAVKMASAAQVSNLILTHHDPRHCDDQLDTIRAQARAQFPNTLVAYEGLVLDLPPRA